MNNFVIVMHKIYDNFLKYLNDSGNDIIYNELITDLGTLDDLINNHQIPSDVFYKVKEFHEKVYLKISYLKSNNEKNK